MSFSKLGKALKNKERHGKISLSMSFPYFRGRLIMLVNDRAENFEADLFLRQRSIAGYATEAKG